MSCPDPARRMSAALPRYRCVGDPPRIGCRGVTLRPHSGRVRIRVCRFVLHSGGIFILPQCRYDRRTPGQTPAAGLAGRAGDESFAVEPVAAGRKERPGVWGRPSVPGMRTRSAAMPVPAADPPVWHWVGCQGFWPVTFGYVAFRNRSHPLRRVRARSWKRDSRTGSRRAGCHLTLRLSWLAALRRFAWVSG